MDANTENEFPNFYSLRVIGHAHADLEQTVQDILHRHGTQLTPESEKESGKRHSREGNYVSITIQFVIQSRAQLEAIYADLKDNEHVLMVL